MNFFAFYINAAILIRNAWKNCWFSSWGSMRLPVWIKGKWKKRKGKKTAHVNRHGNVKQTALEKKVTFQSRNQPAGQTKSSYCWIFFKVKASQYKQIIRMQKIFVVMCCHFFYMWHTKQVFFSSPGIYSMNVANKNVEQFIPTSKNNSQDNIFNKL